MPQDGWNEQANGDDVGCGRGTELPKEAELR